MLRRFIPKGKDLSFLTQDDLDRFSAYLNTLPRKSLGYSSPEDLFEMELSAIMTACVRASAETGYFCLRMRDGTTQGDAR